MKYWYSEKLYLHELLIDEIDCRTEDYVLQWLRYNTRQVCNDLPINNLNIQVSDIFYSHYKNSVDVFANCMISTNKYARENSQLLGMGKDWQNVLFLGVDNHRYTSFFDWLKDEINGAKYIIQPSSFDPKTRRYHKPIRGYTMEELLDEMQEIQAGILVTVNNDDLFKFSVENGIDLYLLIPFLGLELIVINNDPGDLELHGHLLRAANHKNFGITNMGVLSEYWDKKYKNRMKYIGIPQDYRNRKMGKLSDDYKVIVLSQSRWGATQAFKVQISDILNTMQNPLTELSLWYLSIHRILQISDTSEHIKAQQFRNMHLIFYYAAQALKHDIVNNICTERNVEIYGDEGWENVCPGYFKGHLNKQEMATLFSKKNNLFLLLNFGFTYLDHSGPIYDMVKEGLSWINVPAIVKTPELEGLSTIEYSNYNELNTLIENVREPFNQAHESLSSLHNIYKQSTLNIISFLKKRGASDNGIEVDNDLFTKSYEQHGKLLESSINAYLESNEESLRHCIQKYSKLQLYIHNDE
ncbi:hypothetical protein [Prochlorococcus sp. MIT 1306]|uniref:hypothetical protein n=1 Tax=Prochlorococcus sp. MIT 1306 TaxID=1799667 RepID=UPI0007B3A4EC|nr:hypothetical protein [Prochlorococcus sp. MIT 1306]KZR61435.1 hypothetical protein PMIT1306_02216 [Prochlorococcus sp. MIT 1306]